MSNGSSGVFDSNQTFESFFIASERIYLTVQFALWLRFREFWAPATAASSSGTLTSASSGTLTSASGGSSSPTSDASLIYTTHDGDHYHVETGTNTVSSGGHQHTAGTNGTSHSHTVTIAGHDHTVAGHDHTVAGHVHGLDFGIFREAMPASINVDLKLWRKPFVGGAWALVTSISGLDQVEVYLDLTSWFVDDPSGLWLLTLKSAAGQPNGGRLAVDVVRDAYGAIQSA